MLADDPPDIDGARDRARCAIRVAESAKTALDLYTQMLALYLDRLNAGALRASALER